METNNNNTAAVASIDDITECEARADAQVRALLGRVLAQKRSAGVALDYVTALAPGTKANCWALAEAAGHEGWGRMQGLLRSYQWDWKELRAQLPALAAAWLPDRDGDLTGPGIAIDETAQLKNGDATACVAPQHAGCTGKVENCVTTVFSAYVTPAGQAWADFDIYMPRRWAQDLPRRRAARIPVGLELTTKPQLAVGQLRRLKAAGLPAAWAAADEVYGRSSSFRQACQQCGLAYVVIIPCDYLITTPAGTAVRADQAAADAVFERRSCGTGTKGPRFSDWAMIATGRPRELLLIRRLLSRPDQLTYYLCWAPEDRPATMTYFITIAGRRWPAEETVKTGKDTLGWDQSQARTWNAINRHTALTALAQLRTAAARATLAEGHGLPAAAPAAPATAPVPAETAVNPADLQIHTGGAPLPVTGALPCPPGIPPIALSHAETSRITRLARDWKEGLLTAARLAFHLRWSAWRRCHQARARWHHYSARLAALAC